MKYLLLIFGALVTITLTAQVPQGINYQATIRNSQGGLVTNQAVGFKFNIRQGSGSGTIAYAETQTPTTDQFGGISLVIGHGNVVTGNFGSINWASGTYYNEVLLDVTGGTNYTSMGASQLMSVPYALYAGNVANNNYDTSSANELQNLLLKGDTLSITQGNTVILPFDGDKNSTNEIQNLSLSNDTLKISNGNQIGLPYNSQMNFDVFINSVSISDASINDVMLSPTSFLTETNYKYKLIPSQSSTGSAINEYFLRDTLYVLGSFDSTHYRQTIMTPNSGCLTPPFFTPVASDLSTNAMSVSPGHIFYMLSNFYYVPHNAAPVTLSNYYLTTSVGCAGPVAVPKLVYPVLLNNPAVTGFNFTSPALSITYKRK